MSAKTIRHLFVAGFIFAAGVAQAQTAGTVTLQANRTSSTGSFAPVLTWSTNPVASSCTASGGWSGTKAVSGTQTLPTITASTNYTLTCAWANGSTSVSWVAPTTNTDGSPLVNLAGFRVYYGTSSTSLTNTYLVDDMTRRSATISPLTPGTWYFAVRAFNTSNVESDTSNVASKTITGATAARTVNITITGTTPPVPPPTGTLRTTSVDVYDVLQQSNGSWSPRAIVGRIAIGRTCSTAFTANGGYYQITRSDVTMNGTSPWSNILVARCATS
ncbi:MAG TPA: fibronectin type III domain-containing protein [Steroidobacteraceae bacterium]|nr:fibronectin type III domain-containing protein [Steroidobacteraceae bacterium]